MTWSSKVGLTWSMTNILSTFWTSAEKNTLTLNPDKMQFRLPQVSFFGHQWSAKGLSPDPKKIAAVKRMDLPQRCGDDEKFPRTCELPQQIQSMFSRVK